jgi:hypothetical protein
MMIEMIAGRHPDVHPAGTPRAGRGLHPVREEEVKPSADSLGQNSWYSSVLISSRALRPREAEELVRVLAVWEVGRGPLGLSGPWPFWPFLSLFFSGNLTTSSPLS